MLSLAKRTTILEMHESGIGIRKIARLLKISRVAARKVIRAQAPEPPKIEKPQLAEPHRDAILALYSQYQGNQVRVHEELSELGISIAYPTLTAFCRSQGIGQTPRLPAGRYHFEPGQEIQHDTSPHRAMIAGKVRKIQTAGAVLCHSRMRLAQCYPRFTRFECKVFLTEALKYFDGSPETMMIDNTHVVVLRGTGAEMIPVPEMEAFAERLGFQFQAHEVGDANRSAHVERFFHHFENNFLAGRSFQDLNDLNRQARQWCEKINSSYKRHLKAKPIELYAMERTRLRPLPAWIPEPTLIHHRTVDTERYVNLHTNRYSVPADWISRQVQVRETWSHIDIDLGQRKTVRHPRIPEPSNRRSTLPEHRTHRTKRKPKEPSSEETTLAKIAPELDDYVKDLKKRGRKQTTLALRQLLRMAREYPREPIIQAINTAAHYGLYDLDRVETIVLRAIASDYFLLDPNHDKESDDD
jgi:transposase